MFIYQAVTVENTFQTSCTLFYALNFRPQDKRLQAIWCAVDKLPKPNYDNFRSVSHTSHKIYDEIGKCVTILR